MPVVSAPVPHTMLAELQRRAQAEDRSLSAVIRRLLTRALLADEDSRAT
jgi:hypothetical protein